MDENRRAALLAELEDMKREYAAMGAGIQFLAHRLGVPADLGEASAPSETTRQPEPGTPPATPDDLVSMILADEFYGMSIPKAAGKILERWSPGETKRPIKTTTLVAAMKVGGLDVDARQVYRSLWNGTKFHNIGKGRWGLVSWYPPSVLNKAKGAEDAPDDADLGEDDLPADSDDGENVRPIVGRTEPTTGTEVAAS